jgi:hypothetical protein
VGSFVCPVAMSRDAPMSFCTWRHMISSRSRHSYRRSSRSSGGIRPQAVRTALMAASGGGVRERGSTRSSVVVLVLSRNCPRRRSCHQRCEMARRG